MSEWVASIMTSGVDWRTNLDLDGRQSGPRLRLAAMGSGLTLPSVHPSVRAVTLRLSTRTAAWRAASMSRPPRRSPIRLVYT